MKKIAILTILIAFIASSCTRIGPGYEGFKYSYAGNDKGVAEVQPAIGWTTYMPFFSTVIEFPISMQHWEGEVTTFFKGGASFKCPIGYNYNIQHGKSGDIYFMFKTDNLQAITDGYLYNTLRNTMNNVAGGISLDSFITNTTAYKAEVERQFADSVRDKGFMISQYGFTAAPEPTDGTIKDAIHAKIAAKQTAERKQQELLSTQADAAKEVAQADGHSQAILINARTEAAAIKLKQAEITPTYVEFIKWSSWDGKLPETMLGSNTSVLMNK